MGKSPGKWIKTVLFGKKSSKSNLSKDATLEKNASIKSQSKDIGADSTVISSPVHHVISFSSGNTQLEKSSSANLMHDTADNIRSNLGLDAASDDELIRLEQAATKAQAAFRGYLARRAFWALKGIIRLQAVVRGHLVRRQAVATLSCMRAIVELQALVRGQRVRLSGNGFRFLQKGNSGEHVERANLLQNSLKWEKLSTNAFGAKLVASSNSTMSLNIRFDPAEPNSVRNWLERWSSSNFWEPLPQPKKTLNVKPKRKQTKLLSQETETARPKRSVRRVPAPILDKNNKSNSNLSNSTENEKPKRTARKVSTLQVEPVQDQSYSELDKVKQSLRKISVSSAGPSEKSEPEKINDVDVVAKEPDPESLPALPLENKPLEVNPLVETLSLENETNGKIENVESNGKENHKTRRRKSLPSKQEYPEGVSQNTPTMPSYMAATESAKAKLRAQAAAKAAEDGAENGSVRRHSLPSSIGKLSLQSPRVQKPLQANGKGGSRVNKSQISPRDDLTR
uniref:protein IQ-DOMAIN 31-like isoform X2 n=1 Tax=Erigeron canadensis TaxID=72917 RepID=UPI001CB8C46E|nr:protein IQ-DOMAIN 31-like isoform X2 [Erigeron canadensis]